MSFKHIGTMGNIALLFANIIIHLTVQKTTFPWSLWWTESLDAWHKFEPMQVY